MDTRWFKTRLKERKATQATLGEAIGRERSVVSKILDGKLKFNLDYVEPFAHVLAVTKAEVLSRAGLDMRGGRPPGLESPEPPPLLPRKDDMPRDVPVEGTAAGSTRGAFQIEGGPVDFVRRPPGIEGAKDVYALYVVNDSMEPRFVEGELIYVHPGRPVQLGNFVVVVQKTADHEPPQAYVKRLVRRDRKTLVLEQFNPAATLELPQKTVQSVHRILTMNELFGV